MAFLATLLHISKFNWKNSLWIKRNQVLSDFINTFSSEFFMIFYSFEICTFFNLSKILLHYFQLEILFLKEFFYNFLLDLTMVLSHWFDFLFYNVSFNWHFITTKNQNQSQYLSWFRLLCHYCNSSPHIFIFSLIIKYYIHTSTLCCL